MARIAFLVDDLRVGGSELFLRDLCLSLKEDQEVRMIGLFAGGAVGKEVAAEGVPVRVLGLRKWNAPWKVFELIALLNDGGIEVLHCERLVSSIVGVIAGRLAGTPKVIVRRGSLAWWPGRIYRTLDRIAMMWSDRVVASSRAIRDSFVQEQGLPQEKFVVIPHGVRSPDEPSPTDRERKAGGRATIGCVANFNWRKDHDSLLEAFREVSNRHSSARLVLVGTGDLEAMARKKAEGLGLGEKVEFLGSRLDVPEILRRLDLLVLPSKTEGFGRVLIEAMAAGVPIVATRVGGIPEVVTDGRTGRLVPTGSPKELAQAILHVLDEPDEAERLAAEARKDVVMRFSLDAAVSRYRDLILVDSQPGGR